MFVRYIKFCRPQRKFIRRYVTDDEVRGIFQRTRYSRVSIYDPKAKELISAIQERHYQKALRLVKLEHVNVNCHDIGENTPLTTAARYGDCEAIKFLVTELGANVHASCDCPHHKTALHYAAEFNHRDAVKLLLNLGADPRVKDSRNYEPLKLTEDGEIKNLLSQNSNPNTQQSLLK